MPPDVQEVIAEELDIPVSSVYGMEAFVSMGFGAGMGLPNMRKNADKLEIISGVGEG